MPTVTFTWNSFDDARRCKKCAALHNYMWIFKDDVPTVLEHPEFGVVWDFTSDESRAHGLESYNCRCWLTTNIDDSDLREDLEGLNLEVTKLTDRLKSFSEVVTYLRQLFSSFLSWLRRLF